MTRGDVHAWREDYKESREQPESYPWSAVSDYVLLIREDELGAKTARMYRLDLPMGVTF